MYCVKKMTEDLYWVGGNDRRLALFENVYPIPRGVSYNAYVVLDEKPDIVREKIVELAGDLPRIELFARQSPTGWDVWGNEVDCSIQFP